MKKILTALALVTTLATTTTHAQQLITQQFLINQEEASQIATTIKHNWGQNIPEWFSGFYIDPDNGHLRMLYNEETPEMIMLKNNFNLHTRRVEHSWNSLTSQIRRFTERYDLQNEERFRMVNRMAIDTAANQVRRGSLARERVSVEIDLDLEVLAPMLVVPGSQSTKGFPHQMIDGRTGLLVVWHGTNRMENTLVFDPVHREIPSVFGDVQEMQPQFDVSFINATDPFLQTWGSDLIPLQGQVIARALREDRAEQGEEHQFSIVSFAYSADIFTQENERFLAKRTVVSGLEAQRGDSGAPVFLPSVTGFHRPLGMVVGIYPHDSVFTPIIEARGALDEIVLENTEPNDQEILRLRQFPLR